MLFFDNIFFFNIVNHSCLSATSARNLSSGFYFNNFFNKSNANGDTREVSVLEKLFVNIFYFTSSYVCPSNGYFPNNITYIKTPTAHTSAL